MTARDRVIRTLLHEPVDRAPRDLWVVPGIEKHRGDELGEVQFRYPNDIALPEFKLPRALRARRTPGGTGDYSDAWGCVWSAGQRGDIPTLKHSPLADVAATAEYRPPIELLEGLNMAGVNRGCAGTSRFVLARTQTRPLDRFRALRGPETALADLVRGAEPGMRLLAAVHEFSIREIEVWAATDVDGIALEDDWGSQSDLTLPAGLWREVVKPLYRRYCEIIHAHDKFVFFKSAGCVEDTLEDLLEIGIDAVHMPLASVDFRRLADQYRNRITFWGGLQGELLARGTPEAVRQAVHRCRAALDFGRGGLIAQCQWGPDTCFENIVALFESWLVPVRANADAR
jgi:hypothetical protein